MPIDKEKTASEKETGAHPSRTKIAITRAALPPSVVAAALPNLTGTQGSSAFINKARINAELADKLKASSRFLSQGFEQGLKSSLLETRPQVLEQLNKVNSLHNEIAEKVKDLQKANKTREEMEAGIKALKEKNEELLKSQALAFLLERVTPSAHEILRRDTEFAKRFSSGQQCKAFVMSLDIRRSTDLMLKAKEPQLFAEFMTDLCLQLQLLVTDNYHRKTKGRIVKQRDGSFIRKA